MKKSLLPLLAGLVMASPAIGRQLTPQEALASPASRSPARQERAASRPSSPD